MFTDKLVMTDRNVLIASIIVETLRETKESIPAGHLYAMLMGHVDLSTFQQILDWSVQQKLLKRNGFLYSAV